MSSQGSPIEKQGNYLKHSELSVLSVLKLAAYSEQINNWHSSVIIQAEYDISMNQLCTVFVKNTRRSPIIQYYQISIILVGQQCSIL